MNCIIVFVMELKSRQQLSFMGIVNNKLLEKHSFDDCPKVTIVTITYNLIKAGRKDFFKTCVESVYNQTYPNIEHIIIDGASDDGTLELIKEVAYKSRVFSEPDSGIYDAFNKGIEKSEGKYILFLNSDDFFHNPEGIEQNVKYLVTSNADFSYSGCYYVDENNRPLHVLEPILSCFFFRMPFSHQSMLLKKETIEKVGRFSLDYRISSDYDMVIKVLLSGASCIEVPHKFVSFRYGGLSQEQREVGTEDCIELIKNRLSTVVEVSHDCAELMHKYFIIPKNVYYAVLDKLESGVRRECEKSYNRYSYNYGEYYFTTDCPVLDPVMHKIKFLMIPLMRYYVYEDKTLIRLFDLWDTFIIDCIKDKTIFSLNLFGFKIPICAFRSIDSEKSFYLFNIPIFKTYFIRGQ